MKIGVNLYLLQPHVGGMTNYVLTLLRAWSAVFPDDEWTLFTFDANNNMLPQLPGEMRERQIHLKSQEDILNHLAHVDVFFCPFVTLYPRPVPVPSVVTLPDIQARFFPEYFSPEELKGRLYHLDGSLIMADRIITISDFSAKTLQYVLRVPAKKIDAIPLCPDELPEGMVQPELPVSWTTQPFALFPSNDLPHKNHRMLLKALALLKKQEVNVRLVLTGSQRGILREWQALVTEMDLQEQVIHLGLLPRDQLAWLYRHARMLLFPSRFEGFGLPVAEAMRVGLPVACAGTTCLPEVGGESAVYFNPEDIQDMSAVIKQVWTDESLRKRMSAKGLEQANRYDERVLVTRHRAAFQKAQQQYSMLRYLWNKHIVAPWRQTHQRLTVPKSQLKRAKQLLDG
ncbi:MAG: glycosyltransferase family 1 protein [Spartobacteria bacterium]|nr:glycosyltransferase family 1 protein [Spartobacteria bacterium]